MSSVMYFVHPCASSKQNGLHKIALVLHTLTESNFVSSLVVSLCCRPPVVGCQHSRLSAREPWLWNSQPVRPPQETSTNHLKEKQTKRSTSEARSSRNTTVHVCWFSMLFWLLKTQEWWGLGGSPFFVICFLGGGSYFEKINHSGPRVWWALACVGPSRVTGPRMRWVPGAVAVQRRLLSTQDLFTRELCYTSVLLRTDYTLILLLPRSSFC